MDIPCRPSWESYVVEQACAGLPGLDPSFHRTAGGAEIDLVLERGGMILAIEAKATSSPRVRRVLYEAVEDIKATHRFVVAPLPQPDSYPIGRDTVVCTPEALLAEIRRRPPRSPRNWTASSTHWNPGAQS